jgi:hypothetical protein
MGWKGHAQQPPFAEQHAAPYAHCGPLLGQIERALLLLAMTRPTHAVSVSKIGGYGIR